MELLSTKAFQRDYKNLPSQIQKQIGRKLELLLKDIYYHPSLRIKKTKGKVIKGYKDVFEGRITKDYRFLFLIEDNYYILLRCGHHDDFF